MGRTLPSITQVFLQEQDSLRRFRRALRRNDQRALDDLLDSAHRHLAAAANASHALPFEIFLLSMLLEEHKEVKRLRLALVKIALAVQAAGLPVTYLPEEWVEDTQPGGLPDTELDG